MILALAIVILVGAMGDAVGLALLVPFIDFVGDPSSFGKYQDLWIFRQTKAEPSATTLAVFLFAFYACKNAYLALVAHWQYRFVAVVQTRLSATLFTEYMNRPYLFHVSRNSTELQQNVITEISHMCFQVVVPILTQLTEILTIGAILIMLLLIQPELTLVAIISVGSISTVFYRIVKGRLTRLGVEQQVAGYDMRRWVTQGLGGIKEVRVFGKETFFTSQFARTVAGHAQSHRHVLVVGSLPRLFMETAVVGGIAAACLAVSGTAQMQTVLPSLALLGIAAVRILPSASRIMSSLTTIRFFQPAVDMVYRELMENGLTPTAAHDGQHLVAPMKFQHKIEFKDLSFSYPSTNREAIRLPSLTVRKGESLAIVGPSGAGKTTLIDLLLGLLAPIQGKILVDGVDITTNMIGWRRHLAYIPQHIYLMDDTVRRNVALGLAEQEIDDKCVWKALHQAALDTFIASLPDGLETLCGEEGVRLSGGQRQRLGIARALYTDRDILVFDEATSSLDQETESEIADAIDKFTGVKTVFVVAHRFKTIERCDRKLTIVNGAIESLGPVHPTKSLSE